MLLDRIDIDAHGPLSSVELGPFSEHLNVVSSPDGSGKTAIVRFIRDSLVNREYPLGMMSSSTGRVVWADRHGMLHCRREKDGTATGRRTVQFESRGSTLQGELASAYSQGSTWVGSAGTSDSMLAMKSIQLPESLVDGVITDSGVTSVARVVSACVRSGLDSPETYRSLPLERDSVYSDRNFAMDSVGGYRREHVGDRGYGDRRYEDNRHLREELASIEAELSQLTQSGQGYESMAARRAELVARLDRANASYAGHAPTYRPSAYHAAEFHHADHFIPRSRYTEWQHELTRLHDRTRDLRFRQSELRRWIAEIDNEAHRHNGPITSSDYAATQQSPGYRHHAAVVDDHLRSQLDDLDTQMIRWRRALLEVRGLRQAWLAGRESMARYSMPVMDEASLRQMRMDGFLHAIDRYEPSRGWDDLYSHAFAGTYRPLVHLDEMDARIDSATRHIDWLLSRYAGPENLQHAWFESIPSSVSYGSATSLGDTLRAIREDLRSVHRYTVAGQTTRYAGDIRETGTKSSHFRSGELEELQHSESWLVAAIEGLTRHRDALLHRHNLGHQAQLADWTAEQRTSAASYASTRYSGVRHPNWASLRHERDERSAELRQVTAELDDCLRSATEIRRSMRSLPVIDSMAAHSHYTGAFQSSAVYPGDWIDREAIAAEIRSIDTSLASSPRRDALRRRRSEILDQLRVFKGPSRSPLADAASNWLVRLSAGRLQRIDWPHQSFRVQNVSAHSSDDKNCGVTINGRDEHQCTGAERALAVMAIRLAAGDLLCDLGRPVPLVFETHRELFGEITNRELGDAAPLAYFEHGDHGRSNHPIAAALRDYSHRGRQVVVLTSHQGLADQLARVGARTFSVRGQRTVHPHRPLWRPQYESESYVGPHPHTYGSRAADEVNGYVSNGYTSANSHPVQPCCASRDFDINRDFDMAWREAYGFYDNPDRRYQAAPCETRNGSARHDAVRTDWAPDGVDFRDGYYFADTYTTDLRDRDGYRSVSSSQAVARTLANGTLVPDTRGEGVQVYAPESPFYLSVDSPIDQAPSVDAVAAARLRGLSVTHINHLMQQDSNRLSDALGLASVDAATIRRWQAECRLACRVPQLRGFDARVLVGCGITTPAQLASIHPVDLLERVEGFLATDRGQQLLLSGTSHELSRLTSWIAAANSNSDREFGGFRRGRSGRTRRSSATGSSATRSVAGARRSYYLDESLTDDGLHTIDANDSYIGNRHPNGQYAFDSDRYEYEDPDGVLRSYDPGEGRGQRRRRVIRTIADAEGIANTTRRSANSGNDRSSNGLGRGNAAANGIGSEMGSGNGTGSGSGRANGYGSGSGSGSGSGNGSGSGRSGRRRSRRGNSDGSQSSRSRQSERDREVVQYERAEREPRVPREPRPPRESGERVIREPREREARVERDSENELRFYLQRDSPVVDAPSIGNRVAERLHAIGIYTVDDLLNADAATVADELGHRRIDADTVLQWQQQATLVCRVPMLRGHDAQLLVASEVTTPEELAVQDASDLFAIVDVIANSSEGKRIVRGGKLPDLEEVTEWIGYAQHHRELQAA